MFILNLKRNLHSKFELILFVLPIIAVSIFIMILNISMKADETSSEKMFSECRIGIVDTDKTKLTNQIFEYLDNQYSVSYLDKSDIDQSLIKNKVNYVLFLEKGFTERIINDEVINIESFRLTGGSLFTFFEKDFNNLMGVYSVAGELTQGEEEFYTYLGDLEESKFILSITDSVQEKKDLSSTISTFWGFIILFMIYFNCYFGNKFLEDKLDGKVTRITNTKVKYSRYLLKLIFTDIFIGIVQISIISIILIILNQYPVKTILLNLAPTLFMTNVIGIELGLLLATIAKSKTMYQSLLLIFINVFAMLGGLYWPVEMMPQIMIKIAKLTPTYWLKDTIKKGLTGTNIYTEINFLILICFAVAIFLIAIGINLYRNKKSGRGFAYGRK